MRTNLAKNVRIGDRLQCADFPTDCIVSFVQRCALFKRPQIHSGLIESGIPIEKAIMIEFRPCNGPSKGVIGTAYLHQDQRIKAA